MKSLLALLILCFSVSSIAQDTQLSSVAFMTGRWTSSSDKTLEEEYWSSAMGKNMVGTYRTMEDGKTVFYEFMAIEIDNEKPVLKIKHFHPNLISWEEKADAVRLPLTASAPNSATFSDKQVTLTYNVRGDELTIVLTKIKDGQPKSESFHLHRTN